MWTSDMPLEYTCHLVLEQRACMTHLGKSKQCVVPVAVVEMQVYREALERSMREMI
jgi:hypothetical protein